MAVVPSPKHDRFSIAVVRDGRRVTVVPSGDLDVDSAEVLDLEVRGLRAAGFEQMVIDLRGLTFLDSSGLRLLLSLRNDAKRRGRRLVLVPGPPVVQRIFAMTATRTLFDWRDG